MAQNTANNTEYYHELVSRQIQAAKKTGLISHVEEMIITNYLSLKDTEQISPQRYYKICHYLIRIKRDCKLSNFQSCNTAEVQNAFNKIRIIQILPNGLEQIRNPEPSPDRHTRTLSRNSINDMQRVIKSFFVWLADTRQNKNLDARSLEKMKAIRQNTITVTENSILSPDDMNRFFTFCSSKRDNALFRVLYSAALRVGEICNLKFKDVSNICELTAAITNNEPITKPVFIQTNGKTGIIRKIPITDYETLRALYYWYAVYPGTTDPDNYLFVNNRGRPLTPAAISIQIKRISTKAGISKNVFCHLFRHSRITHLCKSGLNETYIKKIAWGHDSRLIDTYTHLSPDDIAEELKQ